MLGQELLTNLSRIVDNAFRQQRYGLAKLGIATLANHKRYMYVRAE